MNQISFRRSLGRSSIAVAILAAALSWPAHAQEAPPAPAPVPAPAAVAPPAGSTAAPPAPAPAQPAAPAPAPAQPAARRREDETPAPGQPAAKPGIGDRFRAFLNTSGLAGLQAQISTLTGERDQLRAQLGAITLERDQLKRDLGEVESALEARTNLVTATATEIANTTGIPQASLPAPVQPEAAKGSLEDLQAQLKTETDSNKRAEISAQIIALSRK